MEFEKNERNTLQRIPARGHYDRETIHQILDAGYLAHVGFVAEGQPYVIPMCYGREGDRIYLHGASVSRLMRTLSEGVQVCLTVTHLDGLALARSAFHHSMNYRSAVVFGTARELPAEEKEHALFVISENILKDRWAEVRAPNEKELKITTVLALNIESASAKIRSGPPSDEKADYELPIWAGVLPVQAVSGSPVPDPELGDGIPLPPSLTGG